MHVRLHHHLPWRQHLRHRPRRAASSAAGLVGGLHHRDDPVHRARVQQACRGADGTPTPAGGVLSWLVSVGLVMAIGTLSVVTWAEQGHTLAIARTMGVVVFSLFN